MNKVIITFFDSLLSPACIVNSDLQVVHANAQFLDIADITKEEFNKGRALKKCITTDLFKNKKTFIDTVLVQQKSIIKRKVKARNSKGIALSLYTSIISTHSLSPGSDYLIFMFSETKERKTLQNKYRGLYEKEKKDREKFEDYNKRLNELIDNKDKDLKTYRREIKKTHASLDYELEIAKSIQSALIQKTIPDLANIDITGMYIPAGKIGGDMFDVIRFDDNRTAVLIFDVSGHGVPSALICTMAKMLFTSYIKSGGRPSEIFSSVNKDMCSLLKTDRYLTAFLGIIDLSDNSMIYSQAGHVYPVLYHNKSGKATFVPGNSIFIGHSSLSGIATYHDSWLTLEWGDKLVLYTDGLTEAANKKSELYGAQRLSDIVEKYGKYTLKTFINKIAADNKKFRNGRPLRDDFTVLCIQIGCPEKILKMSGFTKKDQPEMLLLHSHDEIENICSIIQNKLGKKGYSNKEIFQAHQSIHEILSNAIQHGNKYNTDKKVFILYKITLENFYISVIDEGKGFNYHNLPDPIRGKGITSDYGKGLFIVKKYMDEVTFNVRGNRVMISKFQKQE